MGATLLVELLTEELPPKSLRALSAAFAQRLGGDLAKAQLTRSGASAKAYATPRRLAVSIPDVEERGADRESEVTGPSAKAPEAALAGFAKKHGIGMAELQRKQTPKGEVVFARVKSKGAVLDDALAGLVGEALAALPIPKMMRWGAGEAQFVRPAHGLVMLHGARVVPGSVLGLASSNTTRGHRFLGKGEITLASAEDYERQLREEGRVIADFGARRALIDEALKDAAQRAGASLGGYEDLLDEVTALVEHPTVYVGGFDASFLEVPQECLILTMRQNQKYFPLFAAGGKLLPKFLIVSNMQVADPRHIVGGNERVVRPRLEDARFFYNQDRRTRLEERVPKLAAVVYHNKLGSQLDRTERVRALAGRIAETLKADAEQARRAGYLAKADLLTGMVGEFPELQGIMGRYYALHDKEPPGVADAIEAHYRPRFAGDALPESHVACAVALADKLDSLAGLFGIGQTPTGDKDPFGLRRAALGVVRILVERKLPLRLPDWVNAAFADQPKLEQAQADLSMFIFERARGYFRDAGYSPQEVDAVLSMHPTRFDLIPSQLEAVRAFAGLPEAESLAAANKRVVNILKQAEAKGEALNKADGGSLKEPAERELFDALLASRQKATPLFEQGDYTGYLKAFAVLKSPVDAFFDSVKVMVDEDATRRNRLALLRDLREAMNRVADLSKLAT
jgi:glycyl-tRNA synthetase beta chain